MNTTHRHGDARRRAAGEHGWAEVVILLLFAAVIGFAFVWALVLHEKPPVDRAADATTSTTADPLVPATLPPPRKYKVDGGVNVRQGPATNTTVLTKIEDGKAVIVECQIEGQDVTGASGSTNLWLRINLGPFGVGYVSALYVDTGKDIEDQSRIATCI